MIKALYIPTGVTEPMTPILFDVSDMTERDKVIGAAFGRSAFHTYKSQGARIMYHDAPKSYERGDLNTIVNTIDQRLVGRSEERKALIYGPALLMGYDGAKASSITIELMSLANKAMEEAIATALQVDELEKMWQA